MDSSWRVFHILTEPVQVKCGKLSTNAYVDNLYGHFYGVQLYVACLARSDNALVTAAVRGFTTN